MSRVHVGRVEQLGGLSHSRVTTEDKYALYTSESQKKGYQMLSLEK